jgi:3-methyladenine DNA glycosylase AlkD
MTVTEALAWLERRGSRKNVEGMRRYGIVARKAYGVSMRDLRQLARAFGQNHRAADALWKTGWYEARALVAFIGDPARLTPAQMDRWARDFDNWAICDTLCFHLFDRSPHAWTKIRAWSTHRDEFVRRAAFALLASVALHDKTAPDAPFARSLRLIERAASDERNFVKKAVSWALRAIGRRNKSLHRKSVQLAEKLAQSDDATERWVGKDVLRDLRRPLVLRRLK